ncbi:MAG: hypothetical protein UZ22_OP11002000158 [Microgenomates bacterium OLB23]|nr:MAG: hypothetical protein UZ22_OP11002000158 [Microgenomates bacterium OLB23]
MSQKELLIITVTIFLTIVGWIVADLVHVSQTQKIEEINARFSKPIKTTVDKKNFHRIRKKTLACITNYTINSRRVYQAYCFCSYCGINGWGGYVFYSGTTTTKKNP